VIQVVTLRTDVLIRALGPMAGLLQKALAPPSSTPLSDTYSPDQAWSVSDSNQALQSLGSNFPGLSGVKHTNTLVVVQDRAVLCSFFRVRVVPGVAAMSSFPSIPRKSD
jgi:hypothetical protein